MSVHILYATRASATGGRDGHVTTEDGGLDLVMTTPKELGGAGGSGSNPEQLLAAGYAACFLSAMSFVASQGGPRVPDDARVTVTVGVGPHARGGFGFDIQLDVRLPGLSQPEAELPDATGPSGLPIFERDSEQCGVAARDGLTAAPIVSPAEPHGYVILAGGPAMTGS